MTRSRFDPSAMEIDLFGVPCDAGAGMRGTSMGPQALRVANIADAIANHARTVVDRGDLSGSHTLWQKPIDGYRHLDVVTEWNARVHDALYASHAAHRIPIMMGGDHSLAIGSISAAARHCEHTGQTLRVLWLDAHSDFNTRELSPSGNIHGMPVACLFGHGPEALIRIGGNAASLRADQIRQVGIRSVDAGERQFIQEAGLIVHDMRSIDERGMRAVMEDALAGIDDNTHLHVSFDVDFIDPPLAPGVGTPVPGGPTYREAQLCMEMIADTGRLCSLDIVEINPAMDIRNQTALLAVEMVESLFGKSTLARSRT